MKDLAKAVAKQVSNSSGGGRENVCGYAACTHMWQRCKGCLLKELRSVCLSLCVDVFWVREGGGERGRENVLGYAVMYIHVCTYVAEM